MKSDCSHVDRPIAGMNPQHRPAPIESAMYVGFGEITLNHDRQSYGDLSIAGAGIKVGA